MKIKNELNKAILTSLSGKYALYIFQLISLIILSRIFTPEIFGVIATLKVFILFFQMLATSGIAPAIIYHENLSTHDRNGVFSATLIIGLVSAFIFYLLTPFVTQWLNIGNISLLAWVLSFNIFFSALAMLPMASLQKDAKFILIAKAEIIAELVSLAICLSLYYQGFGLEALASKLLFVPILRFILYFYSSTKTRIGRPALGGKISAIVQLMNVAKYLLAFNVLNFFSRNLDMILISKYLGPATVGLYEKSYQVMRYPLQLFSFAINPALQPILTKYKNEPLVVENEFYRVSFKLAALGFFASMVIYWSTYDIVYILFGPQWSETAEILRILAITISLQMVLSATGGVFQAFGATKHMLTCGIFSSITNVTAIISGIYAGSVQLLCMLLVCSFALNYIQCFYILHKNIFHSYSFNKFILLAAFVFSPYINFIFLDTEIIVSTDYIDAFMSCTLISISVLAFQTAIYFSYQKIKLLKF